MSRYDRQLFKYLSELDRKSRNKPILLGGSSGASGGYGSVTILGVIPQNQVAYDTTEAALSGTSASGTESLVDNLNHIRYRLVGLEDVISEVVNSGGVGHSIWWEDTMLPQRTKLRFIGSGAGVYDNVDNLSTDIVIAASGISFAVFPTTSFLTDTAWTTVGELAVGAGAGNAVLLPPGNPGQLLASDDTAPYGLRWIYNAGWTGGLSVLAADGNPTVSGVAAIVFPIGSVTDNLDGSVSITISGGGGATDFLGLSDTPSSYTSQGDKVVSVKTDETGLEFITTSSFGLDFNKILRYDAAGTAIQQYAFTEAGLDSAIADAASGDIITLPPRTLGITTTKIIPVEVTIRGMDREYSVLSLTSSTVTDVINTSYHSIVENLSVYLDYTGTANCMGIDASGGIVRNVSLTILAPNCTQSAFGIYANGMAEVAEPLYGCVANVVSKASAFGIWVVLTGTGVTGACKISDLHGYASTTGNTTAEQSVGIHLYSAMEVECQIVGVYGYATGLQIAAWNSFICGLWFDSNWVMGVYSSHGYADAPNGSAAKAYGIYFDCNNWCNLVGSTGTVYGRTGSTSVVYGLYSDSYGVISGGRYRSTGGSASYGAYFTINGESNGASYEGDDYDVATGSQGISFANNHYTTVSGTINPITGDRNPDQSFICLYNGDGTLTTAYPPTQAGLEAAITAATDGDTVQLPPKTITLANDYPGWLAYTGGDLLNVAFGVTIRGVDRFLSKISCVTNTNYTNYYNERRLFAVWGNVKFENFSIYYVRTDGANVTQVSIIAGGYQPYPTVGYINTLKNMEIHAEFTSSVATSLTGAYCASSASATEQVVQMDGCNVYLKGPINYGVLFDNESPVNALPSIYRNSSIYCEVPAAYYSFSGLSMYQSGSYDKSIIDNVSITIKCTGVASGRSFSASALNDANWWQSTIRNCTFDVRGPTTSTTEDYTVGMWPNLYWNTRDENLVIDGLFVYLENNSSYGSYSDTTGDRPIQGFWVDGVHALINNFTLIAKSTQNMPAEGFILDSMYGKTGKPSEVSNCTIQMRVGNNSKAYGIIADNTTWNDFTNNYVDVEGGCSFINQTYTYTTPDWGGIRINGCTFTGSLVRIKVAGKQTVEYFEVSNTTFGSLVGEFTFKDALSYVQENSITQGEHITTLNFTNGADVTASGRIAKIDLGVKGITVISGDTTLTTSHFAILGDATATNILVTLPIASGIDGRTYKLKKVDSTANLITLSGYNSELIDDSTILVLDTQWQEVELTAYNQNWYVF